MFTKQFQTESPTSAVVPADGADECLFRRPAVITEPEMATDIAEIPCRHCEDQQSLLSDLALAMQLRDQLNQCEQSLLDQIAGPDVIAFLIAGEEYLHPADTPLFPLELVETTRNMGGEAIFTQRYRPQSEKSDHSYVLHSAMIGMQRDKTVVFGFLAPETNGDKNKLEDHFCATACAFRQTLRAAATVADQIRQRLSGDYPSMLVSQSTGRILAANRQLARMVGAEIVEVTELSFDKVRELLSRYVGRMRISLETMRVGQQAVSLVTFAREGGRASNENKVTGFFAHKMRNKLAGITSAASQWLSMKGETIDESSLELADIVLSEAASLNWQLDRLMAYLQSQDQPRRSVAIAEELLLAVQQIRGIATDRHPPIEWDEEADLGRINAPSMACCALFEAVLLRHLAADQVPITIAFEKPDSGSVLRMTVQSDYSQSVYSQEELNVHTLYARRLAQAIGIELRAPREGAEGTLMTELMISLSTPN